MTWDISTIVSVLAILAAVALAALVERMRKTFETREHATERERDMTKQIEDVKKNQFDTNTIAQTYIGKVDVVTQLLIDNQRQRDTLHEHFGKLSAEFTGLREQWTDIRERLARMETKLDLDIDERRAGRR